MELLFDRDPLMRSVQVFHYGHDGEQVIIEDKQDVEGIIEHNKALQNEPSQKGWMRRVASIPLNVLFELRKKGIRVGGPPHETQDFRKWLNDPDNRFFRTDNSKV